LNNQRLVSVFYNELGDISQKMGESNQALMYYQKFLEIAEGLYHADPSNTEAACDLSISYNKLGDISQKMGESNQALSSYQKSLEIREGLYQTDKQFSRGIDLIVSYYKLGTIYFDLEEWENGREYIKRALMFLIDYREQGLLKGYSDYLNWIPYLENFENNLLNEKCWGEVLKGNFDQAKSLCLQAFQLNPESYASAVNLGHTYLLTGDRNTASEYYKKTIELLKIEEELLTGPVADFKLFIERGWQPEICREEMEWMKEAFRQKQEAVQP